MLRYIESAVSGTGYDQVESPVSGPEGGGHGTSYAQAVTSIRDRRTGYAQVESPVSGTGYAQVGSPVSGTGCVQVKIVAFGYSQHFFQKLNSISAVEEKRNLTRKNINNIFL